LPLESLTKAFGIANVMVRIGGMVGNFAGGWAKSQMASLGSVYAAITLLLCLQLALACVLHADDRKLSERMPRSLARDPE
jgi:hypothetical protein